MVLPSIPNSTFSWRETGSTSSAESHLPWAFVLVSLLVVAGGSLVRILMADKVEKFLEELFEPMNWTSTNHG
jgi:hypothetical protein